MGGVSSAASAAPTWSKPATLGPTGRDSGQPQIAVTPAGEAFVVWEGSQPSGIQVSSRAPGRGWRRPKVFTTSAESEPQIAASGRKAVVVWSGAIKGQGSGEASVFAATRLPGGRWSKPENISAEKRWLYEPIAEDPQVAITPQGEAISMWTARDEGHSTTSFIRAATQPRRGDWTSPVGIRGSIEGEEPQ